MEYEILSRPTPCGETILNACISESESRGKYLALADWQRVHAVKVLQFKFIEVARRKHVVVSLRAVSTAHSLKSSATFICTYSAL